MRENAESGRVTENCQEKGMRNQVCVKTRARHTCSGTGLGTEREGTSDFAGGSRTPHAEMGKRSRGAGVTGVRFQREGLRGRWGLLVRRPLPAAADVEPARLAMGSRKLNFIVHLKLEK